jgi:hypothetical protein
MRLALFASIVSLTVAASACVAAPAAPIREAASGLALHFVPVEGTTRTAADREAFMDVGPMSAERGTQGGRSIVVRQRVGLRLEGPYARARVSISLPTQAPGTTVRVNGRVISAIPQVIDSAHRVGVTVVHEVELTVPAHVPAGPFLSNLLWQADSD